MLFCINDYSSYFAFLKNKKVKSNPKITLDIVIPIDILIHKFSFFSEDLLDINI